MPNVPASHHSNKNSYDFKTNFSLSAGLAHLLKLIEQMFDFDFMQPIVWIEYQLIAFLLIFEAV